MKRYRVSLDARCPGCGSVADGAGRPFSDPSDDPSRPTPGDVSVCIYCATLLAFNHDMTVREASAADLGELDFAEQMRLASICAVVKARLQDGPGRH